MPTASSRDCWPMRFEFSRAMKRLLLIATCILCACSDVIEVDPDWLENSLAIDCSQLEIADAAHHLDYGIVTVSLKQHPGTDFWAALEKAGWQMQDCNDSARWINDKITLEYLESEKVLHFRVLHSAN